MEKYPSGFKPLQLWGLGTELEIVSLSITLTAKILLECPNNLSDSISLYTLKGFCCSVLFTSVVFSLLLMIRLWLIYLILHHEHYLLIYGILSP